MKKSKTDVLIIGAGVGGLSVGARLVEKGLQVRIIEKLSYLGGRFSTKIIKGFKISKQRFISSRNRGSVWHMPRAMLTYWLPCPGNKNTTWGASLTV